LFVWGQAFTDLEPILEPVEFCKDKQVMKVAIGNSGTTIVNSAGKVYQWSQNEHPLLVTEISTKKISDIAFGDNFWLALG
jgi:hypothetical protein